jgi:DNA-directed RNA polymerase subunit M/transcription elongation factor TFIIS
MHFCSVCQNMYYISISPEDYNNLVYYCRNCGHTDNNSSKSILMNPKNIFITQTNLKKQEQEFGHIINQYTKLDPTLPRVNNVLCPNDECLTNTDPDKNLREIINIRYDDRNMKYISLCSTCDTVWKTEDHK